MPWERSSRIRSASASSSGDDHPALACRQVLVREEAEAPHIAQRPAHPASPARPRRVSGVLDHRQSVARRDFENSVHPAGVAAVVHDDDRARRRADRGFEVVGTDVQACLLDVTENGRRSDVPDHVRRGHEVQ